MSKNNFSIKIQREKHKKFARITDEYCGKSDVKKNFLSVKLSKSVWITKFVNKFPKNIFPIKIQQLRTSTISNIIFH